MSAHAAKRYAENNIHTSVSTASSGQIIILIYERILDHLKIGKLAMVSGEYAIENFSKAHNLIEQALLLHLDYEAGGEVAVNLGAIYEWSLREIIAGRSARSPEKIQAVIEVLQQLYEAWVILAPKEVIGVLSVNNNPQQAVL